MFRDINYLLNGEEDTSFLPDQIHCLVMDEAL